MRKCAMGRGPWADGRLSSPLPACASAPPPPLSPAPFPLLDEGTGVRTSVSDKRQSNDVHGFTLLEVVLTLGISVVFAIAIYEATRVHFEFTQSGRDKAGRAQLVRGVVGQIQRDLRNVFTGWQAVSKDAASEQASHDETSEESASTANLASNSTLSDYEVPAGGVLGYADAVTIIVARSTAGLPFSPDYLPASDARPMSDLKLVRYWYGSPGVDSSDGRIGLVRQEIDYVPDMTAGDDPASGARTEVIAEEARGLAMRYFDGSSWYTEWDQTRASAPLAVEIVLAMARNPSLRPGERDEEMEYFRVVVAATDADPPADADADSGTSSGASSSESESPDEPSADSDASSLPIDASSLPDLPAVLPDLPAGGGPMP